MEASISEGLACQTSVRNGQILRSAENRTRKEGLGEEGRRRSEFTRVGAHFSCGYFGKRNGRSIGPIRNAGSLALHSKSDLRAIPELKPRLLDHVALRVRPNLLPWQADQLGTFIEVEQMQSVFIDKLNPSIRPDDLKAFRTGLDQSAGKSFALA